MPPVAPCLSLAVAGCGLKETPPFDPRDLQRAERARSSETPTLPMRPLPTTLEPLHPTTQQLNADTNPTAPPTTDRSSCGRWAMSRRSV